MKRGVEIAWLVGMVCNVGRGKSKYRSDVVWLVVTNSRNTVVGIIRVIKVSCEVLVHQATHHQNFALSRALLLFLNAWAGGFISFFSLTACRPSS